MSLPVTWHLFGEDHLPQRILLLAKIMERVTSRKLQHEFGVSLAEWRVLAFICLQGPTTASFIGEAAEIDKAEISRAVKKLDRRGLVAREFDDGGRRSMIIRPTEAGEALFSKIREQRRHYFAAITQDLDSDQKAQLDRMLRTIADAVGAEREMEAGKARKKG